MLFVRVQSIIVITILVLFYSSCSLSENDHLISGSVSLIKLDSVKLENTKPLFGKFVEQYRINDSGDVWIFAERNQDRIFAFDDQGAFINVLGERGRGPKGIQFVSGFDINKENQVLIYDGGQRMLKVFDLTGDLIHSSTFLPEGTLWPHPYSIYAYEDRLLLSVTETEFVQEPHNSKLLALVGYDGITDTLFGMHDVFTREDKSYSAENYILVISDTIFTNSVGSPYIQEYSSNTFQETDYFGENSASFSIPKKEVHSNLPISEIIKRSTGSSVMMGLYNTEHFIVSHMQILTREFFEVTDFSKKKNILVLYDRETKEFIKELQVPHTLGAVHNNKLYFIEDFNPDNYTIGIYEFTNEK